MAPDPTTSAQSPVAEPALTGWAASIRRQLLDWHSRPHTSDDYGYMLTDEPLTKEQVRHLIRGAMWARFSGWGKNDDEIADAVVAALEAARPGLFR